LPRWTEKTKKGYTPKVRGRYTAKDFAKVINRAGIKAGKYAKATDKFSGVASVVNRLKGQEESAKDFAKVFNRTGIKAKKHVKAAKKISGVTSAVSRLKVQEETALKNGISTEGQVPEEIKRQVTQYYQGARTGVRTTQKVITAPYKTVHNMKKTVQNTKQVVKASKQATKSIVDTAKRAPKKIRKSIKTVKTAAKTTQQSIQSIRTSRAAAQYAAKVALATGKKTVQIAIKIGKFSIEVVKVIAKAVIKLLSSLIAAFGPIVIVILLVIVIIVAVVAIIASTTPQGALAGWNQEQAAGYKKTSNETLYSFAEVKNMLEDEMEQKIADTISGYREDYPNLLVERADDGDGIGNWKDVVSVYVALYWVGDATDITCMNAARIEQLRKVFFDMNSITSSIEEIPNALLPTPTPSPTPTPAGAPAGTPYGTPTPTPLPTPTPTPVPKKYKLTINIKSSSAQAMSSVYAMTVDQKAAMSQLLTFEPSVWASFLGELSVPHTDVEFAELIAGLPAGTAKNILVAASGMLGWNYDQGLAGNAYGYSDCSYLAQAAYLTIGIELPRTSYKQGEWCVNNGYEITADKLQPGDLIFYSLKESDNFRKITHVSIYCGNGMVIEASSSLDAVVFRPIWGLDDIVLYAHPY